MSGTEACAITAASRFEEETAMRKRYDPNRDYYREKVEDELVREAEDEARRSRSEKKVSLAEEAGKENNDGY